jgi:outer membrane protein OmpA-like peptidoglycan-associated protein
MNSAFARKAPAAVPRRSLAVASAVRKATSTKTFLPVVQAKLRIGSPNDKYEQEADRVAEQVVRGLEPGPAMKSIPDSSGLPETVQRKCSTCSSGGDVCPECEKETLQRQPLEEEDDVLQAKESSVSTPGVSSGLQSDMKGLQGGGTPLPPSIRRHFQSRFGVGFGDVRVHTDSRAAEAARAVKARAFTLGKDVVFGAGEFNPGTGSGQNLIAHELTHVLQQSRAGVRLQRQTEDFRVTQVQPDPQERTQGMAPRFFFEFDRSDFRPEVPAEAAELARLKTWATQHAGQHVRLVGRASQEGLQSYNETLARRRAATARDVLVAGGVIVDGPPQIDMTYSQRPVEYRFYRSVEVIVAGSDDATCSAFTAAQQKKDLADCETAFAAAHKRAVAIAKAGMARLRPTTDPAATPAPDRDSVLNDRFPGLARATLLPRFESVVTRLGEVGPDTGHVCNHRCAPGCERAASASAGGPVHLCAPFYIPGFRGRTMPLDLRVFAVMHETTHSAVVPGSKPDESVGIDFAYAPTRLFGALEGTEALHNTDSYVVTLLMLARDVEGAPAVLAIRGAAPADTLSLTTPVGETGDRNRTARRAIGFAESWLNYASFWSPVLYDFVAASLRAWSTDELGTLGHNMLEMFAPLFRLQHPGTSALDASDRPKIVAFQAAVAGRGFATPAPSNHSDVQDRTRVAGIYDRLTRMLDRLRTPLAVSRASGDGSWSAEAGLPGIGTDVRLPDTFFMSMTPVEQARHAIRLMARAMADVGATRVEAYVEAADGVHSLRGLGP